MLTTTSDKTKALGPLQSRWGFHPAPYETYKQLRALKKSYWLGVYALANWWRWSRKRPDNFTRRTQAEPSLEPTFGFEVTYKGPGALGAAYGTPSYVFPAPGGQAGWATRFRSRRISRR